MRRSAGLMPPVGWRGLARGRGGRDARPPVLDPKQKKQTVRRTWAGILVAVAVAAGLGAVMLWVGKQTNPEAEPPPLQDRRTLDAGLAEGCALEAVHPGGRPVELRRRPGRMEMVTGEVASGTRLEVGEVQVDFVEVRAPVEGWIERRFTERACD